MSYRAVCKSGDYKLYGRGQIAAEAFGARHAIKKGHVVEVYPDDGQSRQVTVIDGRLAETTEEPPF